MSIVVGNFSRAATCQSSISFCILTILDMDLLQAAWYGLLAGWLAGWLTVHLARLRKEDQEKRLSITTRASSSFSCPAAAVCRRQAGKFG